MQHNHCLLIFWTHCTAFILAKAVGDSVCLLRSHAKQVQGANKRNLHQQPDQTNNKHHSLSTPSSQFPLQQSETANEPAGEDDNAWSDSPAPTFEYHNSRFRVLSKVSPLRLNLYICLLCLPFWNKVHSKPTTAIFSFFHVNDF